jgi:MoaA/NifB/PqqE/SkfB family radical SAM enzyme
MVVCENNVEEIPDVAQLAGKLGVDCVEFVPKQPFTGKGFPSRIEDKKIASDTEKFLRKLNSLTDTSKVENSPRMLKLLPRALAGLHSPVLCYAGFNSLTVDCYGQVFPCHPWANWSRSVGDIRYAELKDIWYSRSYNRVREMIFSCHDCTLNGHVELNLLFQPFRKIYKTEMAAEDESSNSRS